MIPTSRIFPYLLSAASVLAIACGSSQPSGEATPVDRADVEAALRHPDPGPTLSVVTGAETVAEADTKVIDLERLTVTAGHTYVYAPMAFPEGWHDRAFARVHGQRYGLAMPAIAVANTRPGLYVRLVGSELPEEIVVDLYRTAPEPEKRRVVLMRGQQQSTAGVDSEFHLAAADWFQKRARQNRDGFSAFAAARLGRIGEGTPRRPPAARDRSDLGRLMEFYTGASSIEEALQRERGLGGGTAGEKRTIPVSELSGPPIAAHPWGEMLEELDRQPRIEPLANQVPEEMAYLHFRDIGTLVSLSRDADSYIAPLLRALEQSAGDSHFVRRYEEQLAVERSDLAERFGKLAVKGVAVTASDPFVREGTDISLLFHVKSKTALDAMLGRYADAAKRAHPGARTASYQLGKHTVTLLSTPDQRVHRHRLDIGDVVILSNSRGAIERFAAVADGRAHSLARSGDFRYFRALYPHDAENEDGFLFVSDAFVARAVGPRTKILEARRLQARADLSAVANAALLYGWLEGKSAKEFGDLIRSGLVTQGELNHGDGTGIDFANGSGPQSAYGSLRGLTPLIDQRIDRVTAEEKRAYEWFSRGYQQYWTRFMDPIGARLTRSDDGKGIEVEVRMMPLIEGTDYSELAEAVGSAEVSLPGGRGAVRMTLAVGEDAKLRRELDQVARQIGSSRLGIQWLGDWVAIGAADRSGLWDAALASGEVPTRKKPERDSMQKLLPRLPLYAAAHVKSRTGLAAALTALKAMAENAAPGMFIWGEDGSYRDIPVVAIRGTERGDDDLKDLAIHYAIAGDVFVVALERATLEIEIDALLDPATAKRPGAPVAQSWLTLRPRSQGYLQRTIAGLIEGELRGARTRAYAAFESLALGFPELPAEPAPRDAIALAYLGEIPASPHGGRFFINDDQIVLHSIYGSQLAPRVVDIPVPSSAVSRGLDALEYLDLGLAFEGEGVTRGLRSAIRWRRR